MNPAQSGDAGDRDRAFYAAHMAWSLAPELCRPECRHYHRVRPLLRWLGLSAEPADQDAFFRQALGQAFAAGAATALVCGTSDTAMPDLVASSVAGCNRAVTAIDLCETPLRLVAAYASAGAKIETRVADVLDWAPAFRFDVIATHSFLGQFASAARPALMRAWHDMLSPGGRVITVNRLRPVAEGTSFGAAAGAALADEAARRYRAGAAFPAVTDDEIRIAVQSYVEHRRTQPVGSLDEIRSLFEGAGLAIVSIDAVRSASRTGALTGPAMPDGGVYAHVVAQRPAD